MIGYRCVHAMWCATNIIFSYSNIFIPIRIFTYFLNEYILIYSTALITVLSNYGYVRYVRKGGSNWGNISLC